MPSFKMGVSFLSLDPEQLPRHAKLKGITGVRSRPAQACSPGPSVLADGLASQC